ncbi:uncharacterized protein LOC142234921 [Haematobia irritans]|uniref:uncharacterized protein LOC142234921 n=1 Tax=Haematobia irritans TaxID=7368 RepID=UPI003F5097BE
MEMESFDEYLRRLNKRADSCDFKKISQNNIKSTMIRDRLIFGINDEGLKKIFLKEDFSKLTLTGVINRCKVNEITEEEFNNIKTSNERFVNEMRMNKPRETKCRFCGGSHSFVNGSCPAINKTCNICKKKGRFAKCCYSRSRVKDRTKNLHAVEASAETESHSESESSIYQIGMNDVQRKRSKAVLQFLIRDQWNDYECDMDTCSDVSVIGYSLLCKLLREKSPKLDHSDCKLKAFGGSKVDVFGKIRIPFRHKKKIYNIHFHVVNVDHGFLLSEDACLAMGLIKYCRLISAKDNFDEVNKQRLQAGRIVDKFKDIFDGYGKLPGKVTLEFDESVKPVIQRPRRIPVALRDKLKVELNNLEADGIISIYVIQNGATPDGFEQI